MLWRSLDLHTQSLRGLVQRSDHRLNEEHPSRLQSSRDKHPSSPLALHHLHLTPPSDHSGTWMHKSRRQSLRRALSVSACIVLMALGLLHILQSLGTLLRAGENRRSDPTSAPAFANALHNAGPVPCHLHNDYWRPRPLLDAISTGSASVEADVWLIDDQLYV